MLLRLNRTLAIGRRAVYEHEDRYVAAVETALRAHARDTARRFEASATDHLTAAAPVIDTASAMVAVYPTSEQAVALAQPNAAPAETLHVTLAFLGQIGVDAFEAASAALRPVASMIEGELEGVVGGIAAFWNLLTALARVAERVRPDGGSYGDTFWNEAERTVLWIPADWTSNDEALAAAAAFGTVNGVDRVVIADAESSSQPWVDDPAWTHVWPTPDPLLYPSIVLPDVPGLAELRESVCVALEDAGIPYAESHGWTPHLTISYTEELETPTARLLGLPLTFDALSVVRGDVLRHDFPLGAPLTAAAGPPGWTPPHPDEVFNVDAFLKTLRTKTDPVRRAAIKDGMTETLSAQGLDFDVTNPLVGRALARTGAKVTSIADTTRLNVMRTIRRSYEEGLSIPDTAKAIQAGMEEASPARARLIARTELNAVANGGSVAAAQIVADATGDTYFKRWLTAPGAEYPRHEDYEGLNGQTVELDATFDVGGFQLEYPGDPGGPPEEVCNCRCDVIMVESRDEEMSNGSDELISADAPIPAEATPLETDDVDIAARALAAGQDVTIAHPDEVATLIEDLGRMAADAQKAGLEAPTLDLGKVSITGTNLFTRDSLGLPRVKMPQLKGKPIPGSPADFLARDKRGEVDIAPLFYKHLRDDLGVNIGHEDELVSHLRATQTELDGAKVAGIMDYVKGGGKIEGDIPVSREGYIIDGHHRWAADIGLDYETGIDKGLKIGVERVDQDIVTILREANEFATSYGIPPGGIQAGPIRLSPTEWIAKLGAQRGEWVAARGELDPASVVQYLKGEVTGVVRPGDEGSPIKLGHGNSIDARATQMAQQALETIGKVHDVPDEIGSVRITTLPSGVEGADAAFDPASMTIEGNYETGVGSMIHEIGHYLDWSVWGDGNEYATLEAAAGRGPAEMRAVVDAIKNSEAYAKLHADNMPQYAQKFAREYLANPKEAFARAYVQWIGEKTGDQAVARSIAELRKDLHSVPQRAVFWTQKDFEPISAAFDSLFESKGLIAPRAPVSVASVRKAIENSPGLPRDMYAYVGRGAGVTDDFRSVWLDPVAASKYTGQVDAVLVREGTHALWADTDEQMLVLDRLNGLAEPVPRPYPSSQAPAGITRDAALRAYTNSGYVPVNDFLRGDTHDYNLETKVTTDGATLADVVNRLDESMLDSPLPSETTVWRGVRNPTDVYGATGRDLIGKTVDEKAFVSTSADRSVGEKFATPNARTAEQPGLLVKLHVPPGIGAVTRGESAERELTLERNLKIHFDKYVGEETFKTTTEGLRRYDVVEAHVELPPGRVAGKLPPLSYRADVGITPFRAGQDNIVGFYDSAKFARFDRDVEQAADQFGVVLDEEHHVTGIWQGETEPSVALHVHDSEAGVKAFASDLGRAYNQDGVLLFDSAGKDDVMATFKTPNHPEELVYSAMRAIGLDGGRFTDDGRLQIIGSGGRDFVSRLDRLGNLIDDNYDAEVGRFVLLERDAGDYDKAITDFAGARGEQAVFRSAGSDAPIEPGVAPAGKVPGSSQAIAAEVIDATSAAVADVAASSQAALEVGRPWLEELERRVDARVLSEPTTNVADIKALLDKFAAERPLVTPAELAESVTPTFRALSKESLEHTAAVFGTVTSPSHFTLIEHWIGKTSVEIGLAREGSKLKLAFQFNRGQIAASEVGDLQDGIRWFSGQKTQPPPSGPSQPDTEGRISAEGPTSTLPPSRSELAATLDEPPGSSVKAYGVVPKQRNSKEPGGLLRVVEIAGSVFVETATTAGGWITQHTADAADLLAQAYRVSPFDAARIYSQIRTGGEFRAPARDSRSAARA